MSSKCLLMITGTYNRKTARTRTCVCKETIKMCKGKQDKEIHMIIIKIDDNRVPTAFHNPNWLIKNPAMVSQGCV